MPVAALLAAPACTRLDKEAPPAPAPIDTSAVLPTLSVTSDTNGQAVFLLAALAIDRTQPFTLTSSGFRYGHIVAMGDTALAYKAFAKTGWTADTGTIRLCQGAGCRNRTLIIANPTVPPKPPTVEACTTLASISRITNGADGSVSAADLPGMGEAGSRIDSIWGFIATADLHSDSLGFTWSQTGPNVFPYAAAR